METEKTRSVKFDNNNIIMFDDDDELEFNDASTLLGH